MWTEQPLPMEAPAALIPPPDTFDRVQLREVTDNAVDVAAVTAPPEPASSEAVLLPPPDVSDGDVVIATAETHPWWLKPYKQNAERPATDESIQIPPRAEVASTGDRAAAALTAVWIGGAALAAVTEPPADEEEQWPPREPEASDEE